jgi:hypothetical protein
VIRGKLNDAGLRRALEQLVSQSRAKIKNEVSRSTRATHRAASAKAPVATGELKKSLQYYYELDMMRGVVEITSPYGQWVEGSANNYALGRRPGKWPPADPILQWVIIKGIPQKWFGEDNIANREAATFLVRRKIGQKGTPAQPFLKPAYETEAPKFAENVQRLMTDSIKKSGLFK